MDWDGSQNLSENELPLLRNQDKVLFWQFYPWCYLVYNLGFNSLLKHIDFTPVKNAASSFFLLSFPQVDSNSAEHWEPFGIPFSH